MKTSIFAVGFALCAASASAMPVQWTVEAGGNGHFYEFIGFDAQADPIVAEDEAEARQFMGLAGYLATITSQSEQTFLNSIWPGAGSVTGQFENLSFYAIGASDRAEDGVFRWIGGPEEGEELTYLNFSAGEPNNFGGNEDFVAAWWNDSASGAWNDINSLNTAYVVEYGGLSTTAVPLPPALPMLLAGLGALALMRRRSRPAT